VKAFGDQYTRMIARQSFKEFEQHLFADNINGVNRIAFFVPVNVGEFVESLPFRGSNNGVSNPIMQLPNRMHYSGKSFRIRHWPDLAIL
jgi:hypothetical protein